MKTKNITITINLEDDNIMSSQIDNNQAGGIDISPPSMEESGEMSSSGGYEALGGLTPAPPELELSTSGAGDEGQDLAPPPA